MRVRLSIVSAFVIVAAAACSIEIGTPTTTVDFDTTTDSQPSTTAATTTTSIVTSTTSTVAGIEVEVTGCDDGDDAFEVLCRVVELVVDRFVETVDADSLVAGAIRGIELLDEAEAPSGVPERLECGVPADAYAPICDAVAADLDAGDGDVAAIVIQAVRGMLEFGLDDPFSAYLSPGALEVFTTSQSGAVEGIGALVQAREEADDGTALRCSLLSATCRIYIVTPLEGSPAEAVGILAGDVIVGVEGEEVIGRTFDEVTAQVRGPAGSDVDLTIERDGELLGFTVTRASIDIPITETRMLEDDIGYLRLTSFTNNSDDVVRADLEALIADGAETVIFDLQNNPGGSLNAAVAVASEFLGDGLVLRTEDRLGGDEYPVVPGGVATGDLRVVVLVNDGSASASEVVTGALKESGRATVIGENTFGKNAVQRIWTLPDGGGLKLTTARWVTPDGVDYGLEGIAPDIAVDIPQDATSQFLIDVALEFLEQADQSV